MDYCNGCKKEVEDPIILDKNCNLPYCKGCLIKLEDAYGKGKMYSDVFENPDGRRCDRCGKMFFKGYLLKHTGTHNYDCTYCRSCLETYNKIILDLKSREYQ